MNPHKTILLFKDKSGKKVGSIPATADNAQTYATEMARLHKGGTVDYEDDPTGGILAALRQPVNYNY